DNPSDAELTSRALKKKNHNGRLYHAKDGAEAISFIFAEGEYAGEREVNLPKLILLDLKMPKVNGLEVLRKVRQDERTKMIPVVILTSSKEARDISQAYQLGANSFIEKPLDFDKYMSAVTEIANYWMMLNLPPN
ncbi:MAG: response regulator, partial [Bacteroidota bacterium]|nr:response regulator [Bacteroidota bacterium]